MYPSSSQTELGRNEGAVGVKRETALMMWLAVRVSELERVSLYSFSFSRELACVIAVTRAPRMVFMPCDWRISRVFVAISAGRGSEERRAAREWIRVTSVFGWSILHSAAISMPTAPVFIISLFLFIEVEIG
jgi:hypothetical protein